jgi:hypothetical protein
LKTIPLSISFLALSAALASSNPAHAFVKGDNIEKASKRPACEKRMAKTVAKARKKTVAFTASYFGPQFAYLDAQNLFDQDDWYVGVRVLDIEQVDNMTNKAAGVLGLFVLAEYVDHLHEYVDHLQKTDTEAATALALLIFPEVVKLKDTLPALLEEIKATAATPQSMNPMDIPKIMGVLTRALTNVTKAVPKIPKVLKLLVPLVKDQIPDAAKIGADKPKGFLGITITTVETEK